MQLSVLQFMPLMPESSAASAVYLSLATMLLVRIPLVKSEKYYNRQLLQQQQRRRRRQQMRKQLPAASISCQDTGDITF